MEIAARLPAIENNTVPSTPSMKHTLLRLLISSAFAIAACPLMAAPDETSIVRFDIARFEVEGNTLLPRQLVESTLVPFAGKSRDFGDVQRALEALEERYRQAGFNVVQVGLPEQELTQGVIRLQVIETKIGAVRVEGNREFDAANIRASLPFLREGETPDLSRVSSSLKLANENPARKVALQLQTADKDGEIDAVLKVTDERPWKLMSSLDNTGNKSTGETHLTLQAQHANIANLDHVLSVQYTTTVEHPSKVSVYGAGYHIPLYRLGDSIDLFASYSDIDSGSVSAGIFDLLVSGKGSVFGGRYNHALRRIGELDSRLTAGFDYKAFHNNVLLAGAQLGNDVTVHPLSLAYSGVMPVGTGELSFSVTGVRNIPGGSRGSQADFSRVRSGASASYSILRYTAGYAYPLPKDWSLRLNYSGQYSPDALVPGEQFGAGGASSVRGFQERDLSNDRGNLFNAELYTPNLCGSVSMAATQCRALVFADAANAARNKALPGEAVNASIASLGLGVRVAMDKYLSLQMDYGRVVDAGLTQAKGDKRLHVRLGLVY
jgi:hemolysin activation/secretion protein